MDEKRQELLKKIKALADKGIGGEKANAQEMLERMMKKYGISPEELECEKETLCWFRYKQDVEARLLNQIIFMVTGKEASGCVNRWTNRHLKERGVECTTAQRVEIETSFEFYKRYFYEELENFMTAFVYKNDLFPKNVKTTECRSEEEKRRLEKVRLMAQGIDRQTMRKMLHD